MRLRSIMLVTAALAFSATGTVSAQTSDDSTTAPPQVKKARDPNEVVCEKIEVLGSRLASKRVCMSRGEWAEQKRQVRMDTEKVQLLRPCNGQTPAVTQC